MVAKDGKRMTMPFSVGRALNISGMFVTARSDQTKITGANRSPSKAGLYSAYPANTMGSISSGITDSWFTFTAPINLS